MAFPQSGKKPEEPYDHIKDSAFFYDVTEQFKQQMRLDLTCFVKCEVSTISKVSFAKIYIIDFCFISLGRPGYLKKLSKMEGVLLFGP